MKAKDITGQRFHHLTALYPTEKRDKKGCRIWHCRCNCGKETDVSYDRLRYSTKVSCGCMHKKQCADIYKHLDRVDGTIVQQIESKTIRSNNRTGVRGIFMRRGKYIAQICFKGKNYWLGTYDDLPTAALARKLAEDEIYGSILSYYRKWQREAAADQDWAENNPIRIQVVMDLNHELKIHIQPDLRRVICSKDT